MKRLAFMNPLMTAALGATLAWGPGIALAHQTSPNHSDSSQEKHDVPKGTPGEKSPDLKSQHSPKAASPGNGKADRSQNVPHHTPGTNNPDLQQQSKPAPKKKTKQNKGTAPPSSQPSGTPHI